MDKKYKSITIDKEFAKVLEEASQRISKEKGYYVSPSKILKERFKNGL